MARRHQGRVLGREAESGDPVMVAYGRYWAEAFWARARRVPEMLDKTTIEGLDMILAARDAGKGMIYALPHIGNWEAAAPVAISYGIPVVAVAEKLANDRVTQWFVDMRGEFGIEIVLATGGTEVMRKLEQALGENKAVALLSDRDLNGRGVEVEFFGETTTLPAGPATLALRNDAPLFPVASYFDGEGHHIVVRPPIRVPGEGSRSEKVKTMTQAVANEFEELIHRAPEQWHLVVPNWPSDTQ
jgi:KDO2-lipid IV(A) lauroyltransferase